MPRLTTAEISDKLGLSQSTIKAYQKLYSIPRQIVKGKALYPENSIEIFKAVSSLAESGAGLNTIRKRIGSDAPQTIPDEAKPVPDMSQLIPAITEAVQATVERSNDLAEKYARAAHQIGQHEERERQYIATIDELREQVRLLQAPKPEEAKEEKPLTWWARLFG